MIRLNIIGSNMIIRSNVEMSIVKIVNRTMSKMIRYTCNMIWSNMIRLNVNG